MRFRNLLKYSPNFLTTAAIVYFGIVGYDLHKDLREIGDSVGSLLDEKTFISSLDKLYNQIAVQDSILISKLDSINYRLGGFHEELVGLHEEFVAHNSLDSVARSP